MNEQKTNEEIMEEIYKMIVEDAFADDWDILTDFIEKALDLKDKQKRMIIESVPTGTETTICDGEKRSYCSITRGELQREIEEWKEQQLNKLNG